MVAFNISRRSRPESGARVAPDQRDVDACQRLLNVSEAGARQIVASMDPATWPVSDNADRGIHVPSDEDLRATYEEARRQM